MIYNMFYTLASRLIINDSPRNKLYIFLAGSLCYIVIHWYLHMDIQSNMFMNGIKNYLYYIMVADIILAGVLTYMYPKKNLIDKKQDVPHTQEQTLAIAQKMQEARRLQFMRQQEMDHKNTQQNKNLSAESPKEKSVELLKEPSIKQTNPTEQPPKAQPKDTSIHNKVSTPPDNNEKESNTMHDTEIPIFDKPPA